ncbi:phospholipase A [Photobacterium sagamiensis]|uniref:phospholipase A n=1 Tax=Photobacterium sagamiensis TaxID=2910241 RepID=UPI003D0C51CD
MSKKLIMGMMVAYSANSLAMPDCREIVDEHERLACYDSSLNRQQAPADFNLDAMSMPEIVRYFDERELFRLSPHQPNYILPVSYNDNPNEAIWQQIKPGAEINHTEVKFQISGKLKLWDDLYNNNWDLWFGYTQTAWWQLYNSDESAPFRETNYSPEMFTSYYSNINILGFTLLQTDLGFIHQSNGRAEQLSRSWNRIYANFELGKDNFRLSLTPWYRIPEDESDDDNPDIEKYLGYGEVRLSYKNDQHLYSLLLRNNLRSSDNKGGVEFSWAFPIHGGLKGYFQYFNGYGESLIDYNHNVNRASLGILIYDWL